MFDYDGVLTIKTDFAKEAAQRHNLNETAIRAFFSNHLEDCLAGKSDMIKQLDDQLIEIGWQGTSKGLFNALYKETLVYNDEVLDLIKDLNEDFQCYLATNQDIHRYALMRMDERISPLFKKLFCSCELGISKPETVYFEKVYDQMRTQNSNLAVDQIIFIDDLEENIYSAASFGMKTHLFTNIFDLKSFLAAIIN